MKLLENCTVPFGGKFSPVFPNFLPFLSVVVHQISAQFLFASHPVRCGRNFGHLVRTMSQKFPPGLQESPERTDACGDPVANNLHKGTGYSGYQIRVTSMLQLKKKNLLDPTKRHFLSAQM